MAYVSQELALGPVGSFGRFLGPRHFRLCPLALGNIASVALDAYRLPVLVHLARAHFHRNPQAIFSYKLDFIGVRTTLVVLASKYPLGAFKVLGRDNVG